MKTEARSLLASSSRDQDRPKQQASGRQCTAVCRINHSFKNRCGYMNTSNSAVRKASLRFNGVVLLSVVIGGGLAGAETFQHGESTATIEQSGGSGASKSQVTRYKDGQKIITQDGSSTDVTIQGSAGSLPPDSVWEHPTPSADRFDRSWIEKRFSRTAPDGGSADDRSECTASSARKAFKQRMLDRMRRPAHRD